VNRLAVVVPAHDERVLLPACLRSLTAAAEAVAPVPVELIVVADACSDDTALVADGATVLTLNARNVGRARAAGMAYALRHGPDGLWLATTDADSRVRPDWLKWQSTHARGGTALVAGTVEVDDWTGWPETLISAYESGYRAGREHVHGANLGVSAHAYRRSGGFRPLPHDEDRALIASVLATGHRVVMDPQCPVWTSSRAHGRARHGFAAHLSGLLTAGDLGERR
jgi:glycosyltransferase involved in cell wall biosynthesis